jgi:hypothetical protein
MDGAVLGAVATALEERDGGVRFVICTDDRRCRDVLPGMGYQPAGDQFATRWFPRAADAARYYPRFAESVEPMLRQKLRLVPVPWEDALEEFVRRAEGSGLEWWVYGSAALAVRGLDVSPGDLDVNVDDPWLAGRICDDLLVTPVERMSGWVAGTTGRTFNGAVLEWLSEPLAELDDPAAPCEQGPFVAPEIETVMWRGHPIRVPPLSAQLRACERRGLPERAELIRAAIAAA